MRWVEGIVSILQCAHCRQLTAHLIFSGDTDMVTMDLAALSSIVAEEIVVTLLEDEDYSDDTGKTLQARVNAQLGRDDLRFVRLLRSEDTNPGGVSIREYMRAWRPPRVIYACPKCEIGEATEFRSATPSDYRRDGGMLTILAELELRDC